MMQQGGFSTVGNQGNQFGAAEARLLEQTAVPLICNNDGVRIDALCDQLMCKQRPNIFLRCQCSGQKGVSSFKLVRVIDGLSSELRNGV